MTRNKLTRMEAILKADGWHRYPSTYRAMFSMAQDLPATLTAKELAACVIVVYRNSNR